MSAVFLAGVLLAGVLLAGVLLAGVLLAGVGLAAFPARPACWCVGPVGEPTEADGVVVWVVRIGGSTRAGEVGPDVGRLMLSNVGSSNRGRETCGKRTMGRPSRGIALPSGLTVPMAVLGLLPASVGWSAEGPFGLVSPRFSLLLAGRVSR